MKKEQRWSTAPNDKVDLNIVNSNLFPPEIFKHKQPPFLRVFTLSPILLQKEMATRFQVAIFHSISREFLENGPVR